MGKSWCNRKRTQFASELKNIGCQSICLTSLVTGPLLCFFVRCWIKLLLLPELFFSHVSPLTLCRRLFGVQLFTINLCSLDLVQNVSAERHQQSLAHLHSAGNCGNRVGQVYRPNLLGKLACKAVNRILKCVELTTWLYLFHNRSVNGPEGPWNKTDKWFAHFILSLKLLLVCWIPQAVTLLCVEKISLQIFIGLWTGAYW